MRPMDYLIASIPVGVISIFAMVCIMASYRVAVETLTRQLDLTQEKLARAEAENTELLRALQD